MVGTRAGDTKKRSTRRGGTCDITDTMPCLNTSVNSVPNLDAPPTVALSVNGDWAAPPSIGQIEAALTANGRTQHRIWRIDMGAEGAVVHVHPNDVAGCVGIIDSGNVQLKVSVMGATSGMPADPTVGMGAALARSAVGSTSSLSPHPMIVQAVPSPVQHAVAAPAPPKKRAKVEPSPRPAPAMVVAPTLAPPQLCEAISDQLLSDGALGGEPSDSCVDYSSMPTETLLAMRAPPQLALSASSDSLMPKMDSAQQRKEDDKQKRTYRVGLSYRCGRCGKPKKGHVCDMPDPEDGLMPNMDGSGLSPAPAILATTVRKGTPPALLGSPLAHAGSPLANVSPRSAAVAVASPLSDVKVSGEAQTIFKDMVAALGENAISPNSGLGSPGGPAPPQIVSSAGISPLAASAIAAGSVSAAAPVPLTSSVMGTEPQLSEMDLMLADLAFAARPPPVMTPDEGDHQNADNVGNGLGSLSPSNFSPGTMIQQLITTPGGTSGWSASQMAEMSGMPQVVRTAVVAQPSA